MSISALYSKLSYTDTIKDQIVKSGGTVVFTKDNILVASEVSEAQYRELLQSQYIDKIDILPLKRYANEGIKYTENTNLLDNTNIENIKTIPTDTTTPTSGTQTESKTESSGISDSFWTQATSN